MWAYVGIYLGICLKVRHEIGAIVARRGDQAIPGLERDAVNGKSPSASGRVDECELIRMAIQKL